jgi:hypothetical protein
MTTSSKILGSLALLATLSSGCGVSSWVTAPESKYPISLSSGVRDQTGELVTSDRKTVVGQYSQSYKACSMAWRMVSFTGDKDISDEVNKQVSDVHGDALTDVSVTSSGTVWTLLTLIGIFPDCGNVEISGKIVKVAAPPTPALPKAEAPRAPAPTKVDTPPAPAPAPASPPPPAATPQTNPSPNP